MHPHCLASVTSSRLLRGYLIFIAQSMRASCQKQSCLNNLGLAFFSYPHIKLLCGTHLIAVHCCCDASLFVYPPRRSPACSRGPRRKERVGRCPTACKLALTVALIHPPAPQASSCKLFPCSRGGSSAHKGEPVLPQFPPQCVKIEQQIRWFSSTKQAALPAMAVPALPARESQPSAVAGCEEDTG